MKIDQQIHHIELLELFDELLQEDLEIAGATENNFLGDVMSSVQRAALRFANQRSQELEARILHYRGSIEDPLVLEEFDNFFGISTERKGLIKQHGKEK